MPNLHPKAPAQSYPHPIGTRQGYLEGTMRVQDLGFGQTLLFSGLGILTTQKGTKGGIAIQTLGNL